MRKIIVLILVLVAYAMLLPAQVTQIAADEIVLERMSTEAKPHTIYAKEGVQTKMAIATISGEVLELDYPCWTYYIHYFEEINNNTCYYLIVKESSGNLLRVNTKNDIPPDDLAAWRIIPAEPEEPLDSLVLIGKGNLTGSEGIPKQNLVITTETAWENLKTAMNSVNNVTDSFKEADIDFSKYQVIAIFDEIKIGECWTIDITDVTEDDDSITVAYTNIGTEVSTSDTTQPFHIVKIPISDKQIVFQYYHYIVTVLDLNGNWINEQQDTLLFPVGRILIYNPYIKSPVPWFYIIWEIAEDSITLISIYGYPPDNTKKHYFKYLLCKETETIEIHGFHDIERAFYKRIK